MRISQQFPPNLLGSTRAQVPARQVGPQSDDFVPSSPLAPQALDTPAPPLTKASPEVARSLAVKGLIAAHCGRMLRSGRLLFVDQSPFLHTPSLQQGPTPQPLIPGVSNFRQIPLTPIYGVGQPGRDGVRTILDHLGRESKAPVQWFCMREEPVVFVKDQSVVLNESSSPFMNLEAPGSSATQVERREEQLQNDVRREVVRGGGRLLLHEEVAGKDMGALWTSLSPDDVRTPRELFADLGSLGYRLDYHRVPVTDEQAPDNQDFEDLVTALKDLSPETPRVFNCQAGRGRTTTAMVVAQIMLQHQLAARGQASPLGESPRDELASLSLAAPGAIRGKQILDWAIDRASQVQNLRTSISAQRRQELEAPDAEVAAKARHKGQSYLHRYLRLLAFSSYAQCEAAGGYQQSFSQWLQQNPQAQADQGGLDQIWNALGPAVPRSQAA